MHFNHSTHPIIRTSETCFAFAGKIIVLPGNNEDDIGAVECRWVIECDCWCDTDVDDDYDSDDDDDLGAVECRWMRECDCWYDTDVIHVVYDCDDYHDHD